MLTFTVTSYAAATGNPIVPNAQGDAATTAQLQSELSKMPGLASLLSSQSITGGQLASVSQFQGQAAIPANSLTPSSLPTNVEQQRQLLQNIQQLNGPSAAPQIAQSALPMAANSSVPVLPANQLQTQTPAQSVSQIFAAQSGAAAYVAPTGAGVAGGATYPAAQQQQGMSSPGALSHAASTQELFDQALTDAMPMSPQQIRATKQRMLQTQRAAVGYYVVPPKPVSTSLNVDLAPGAQPPVIRLGQGFVSSLVFVDVTGSPWPIELVDLGNPSAFNLQWDKTGRGNTVMAQALTSYTFGNLAVKLAGLNTPVMLTLIPGQKSVDYRVDLRIPGRGPNAKILPIEGLPQPEGHELVTVLEGIPPPGSKALRVKGGQAQAWLVDGRIYLRTRMTVLSPGWLSTVSSADGMHAYMLQRTPHILISQNGKTVQLKLEGL